MSDRLAERIDLPSGEAVWFIDKHPTDPRQDHSYWRHNEKTGKKSHRLAGVTSVTKTLDYKPDNLLKWAAETQCKGIAQLYLRDPAEYVHWLTDPALMWKRLNEEGLTYDQIREQKGEEGTNVHVEAFERLALRRPGLDFSKFNEQEKRKAEAVGKFWFDHDPLAAQVEQVVYSARLKVAGRLDFRGRLRTRCDNHLCACQAIDLRTHGVIDLKTGGFISAAAHAQVGGGYPLLALESEFGPSSWAAILQVFDDGHYEFFKAEGTPDIFEAAVETYRGAGEINKAAGKAREDRITARGIQEEITGAVEAVGA